jgi:sugar/nucleoside kinase (ribokinase family)
MIPSRKDYDLVVIGELNADLILSGDVTPEYGQVEKLIDDASLVLGSSSAIFACGATRLGLRVAFIGKVGDDLLGRFVKEQLTLRGVDISNVLTDPTIKTGLSIILNHHADRAILTYSGSIRELCLADVNMVLVARARHLHMGSFYMLDALRPDVPRLFDDVRTLGLSISIDTNYDPTETWDSDIISTLSRADIFLPNTTELLGITRQPTVETALNAIGTLVPVTAVKLGEVGAMARSGRETVFAPGVAVRVVDTTGAGDSFDAGFVYGHLAGWPLEHALRLGCACGSLSTRAAGGTAAQATLDEALAALHLEIPDDLVRHP